LLLMRTGPLPWLLTYASCQLAGALSANRTAEIETAIVSRASADNRLALL
jgi:hypothetical protein